MNNYKFCLIDGDTIGPELIKQVEKVFYSIQSNYNINIDLKKIKAFGESIEKFGVPFTYENLKFAEECHAIIIGNIGSKKYMNLDKDNTPESGFLRIRKALNICSSIRRMYSRPEISSLSPLKDEKVKNLNISVVRDLAAGMYVDFTNQGYLNQDDALDPEYYSCEIIENTASLAFKLAATKNNRLVSIDKSNVLNTGILWRKKVKELADNNSKIEVSYDYADNVAMKVLINPEKYDVILANNVYGDIIADEITAMTGASTIFGNAELAKDGKGIYTPNQLHYPNEEYSGKNIVSPLGIISSLIDLFTFSVNELNISKAIEKSIDDIFEHKLTTQDVKIEGFKIITCDEMGDTIAKLVGENLRLIK